jgi:hypothetical protein
LSGGSDLRAKGFVMVLKENGKRLPTLSEYLEMVLPLNGSRDDEQVNQFGLETSGSKDEYYLVQTSPDKYRMMPGPEFSPRLYRGQTKRYSTCKPQLFRGIDKNNARQKFCDFYFWSAKRYELAHIVFHHPAVKDILGWDFDGLVFDFDIQAVAQHYQYQTQMLDLSRNRDVAMFFATHGFEGSELVPRPAVGSEAVLYTIDLRAMLQSQKKSEFRLVPIGIDPLPRSAAQSAFALEMDIGGDLEQVAGVQIETFTVTEELALSSAAKIGGEKSLFPYDSFESVILEARGSMEVNKAAIRIMVELGFAPEGTSVSDVADIIREGGYSVSSGELYAPSEQLVTEAKKEWEIRRQSYINRIRWRGTADAYENP